jgi:putative peptidoglycan lipid II flippase
MLLPQGIFAQSLATATFPTFAAQYAAGLHNEMRTTFGHTLRTVFFLSIPAAVGLIVLGQPLISALLERGQFTAESTALVAYALQFYAVGLVAHSGLEIVVRAFYALHDTWTPVIFGIGAMMLNILFSILWVKPLGFGGLALANSVATSLEMIVLLLLLNRRMDGIEARRLLSSVIRSLSAALVMGLAAYFWLRWVNGATLGPTAERWLAAIGGVTLSALVYALMSLVLRNEEMQGVIALVRNRVQR